MPSRRGATPPPAEPTPRPQLESIDPTGGACAADAVLQSGQPTREVVSHRGVARVVGDIAELVRVRVPVVQLLEPIVVADEQIVLRQYSSPPQRLAVKEPIKSEVCFFQ